MLLHFVAALDCKRREKDCWSVSLRGGGDSHGFCIRNPDHWFFVPSTPAQLIQAYNPKFRTSISSVDNLGSHSFQLILYLNNKRQNWEHQYPLLNLILQYIYLSLHANSTLPTSLCHRLVSSINFMSTRLFVDDCQTVIHEPRPIIPGDRGLNKERRY